MIPVQSVVDVNLTIFQHLADITGHVILLS